MKAKKKERGLSIKDIVSLGGKKEDLELLKSVDDEKDEILVEDCEDDVETTDAVRDYIKKINLKQNIAPSKKAKSIKEHGKKQDSVNKSKTDRIRAPQLSNKTKKEQLMPKRDKNPSNNISNDTNQLMNSREKITKNRKRKNKYKLQDDEVTSTVAESCIESFWNNHKPRTALLVKPGTKWFEQNLATDSSECTPITSELTAKLEKFAQVLLEEDINLYKKYQRTREEHSDFNWVKTVINSGTLSDKVAAHTLLIQDSPVHNLASLEALIKMISTKGKRECVMAMDALRDLFLSDLLLEEKKLKSFEQNPLAQLEVISSGNREARDKRLLLWYFESKMKHFYSTFVHALESVSHDTVEKMKQKAVTVMSQLLTYNPEQEQFLLVKLVNKLGDPVHKVAAHVAHLLGKVVDQHPNMKEVIVKEVERLLFRPNITERTQYYALCFLNQLILSQNDGILAGRLIHIYFSFFKSSVKKGEIDTKMMSALLTGVSRAYPYSRLKEDELVEKLDTMYQIVHMVSFNIGVQALMLIFQVLDSKDDVSDRFYTSLYRKLVDPALSHSSKQAMFLNLVYQALKKDVSVSRVKAFVKKLLQVCHYQLPPLVCAILYMISELTKKHHGMTEVKQQILLESDEEEHYQDVIEDDISSYQDHTWQPSSSNIQTNDTAETSEKKEAHLQSSWVHRANLNKKTSQFVYDPNCRNPLYAKAEYSELWELYHLKKHFHPTVSLFAQKLSNNEAIKYSGDPLQDFTLSRFLDRFAYKNPKQPPSASTAGGHRRIFGRRQMYFPPGGQKISVTSDSYVQRNESEIPVEELFLYKYFSHKTVCKQKKDDDSDVESVASDDFDRFIKKKFNIGPDMDEHLDFAADVSSNLEKQGRKQKNNEIATENPDEDDEVNFDDDDDFHKAFTDFGSDLEDAEMKNVTFNENVTFFENDDLEDSPKVIKRKKGQQKLKIETKKKRFDTEGLFASAEEFSTLLDENVGDKIDTTSSQALSNRDNADAKQLSWEIKRDQWLHGRDWKNKKQQRHGKGAKNKRFSKNFNVKSSKKFNVKRKK